MSFFKSISNFFKSLFKRKKKAKKNSEPQELSPLEERVLAHQKLNSLLKNGSDEEIVNYALGHIDHFANFCAQKERANEEKLALRILQNNDDPIPKIANFIRILKKVKSVNEFTNEIQKANISYLKIATASEILMILRPDEFPLLNKKVLFAFFKKYPQPPFQNLKDDELREKIDLMHHKWMEYYPTIFNFMGTLVPEKKIRSKYLFFEAEEIILKST